MIIYTNCLGQFVFDNGLKFVDKKLFSPAEAVANSRIIEEKHELPNQELVKKYPDLRKPTPEETGKILEFFRQKQYFPQFKEMNTAITIKKIQESVNEDLFIMNAINNIEELGKTCNVLTKRLREWYSLHFPELSESVNDNEAFARLTYEKDRLTLMKELKVKDSMGADIKHNLDPILEMAKSITALFEEKARLEAYLDKVMEQYCNNLRTVAGTLIGAKLLREIGSLKKMAYVTSSTLQLLGAEKALFRHIRNKKIRPPKHGLIINHPLIASAAREHKGKAARLLADKISMAAKIDYFKGTFIGDKLLKELEEKLK